MRGTWLIAAAVAAACSGSDDGAPSFVSPGSDAGADTGPDAALGGAGGLDAAPDALGSGGSVGGTGGALDAAPETEASDPDAGPDVPDAELVDAGGGDASDANDASATNACVPPVPTSCGSWACGFNCSSACPTPTNYVNASGDAATAGGRCPVSLPSGKCTNPLPLWSKSGDVQAVILPAGACGLDYIVEVADQQCVRIRTSEPAWGGCTTSCYSKPTWSSPDRIQVHVKGPAPMPAGWISVSWSSSALSCP